MCLKKEMVFRIIKETVVTACNCVFLQFAAASKADEVQFASRQFRNSWLGSLSQPGEHNGSNIWMSTGISQNTSFCNVHAYDALETSM